MRRWLPIGLRLLLAAVFIYAAYSKLRQPWLVFAMSVDAYRILPEWAVIGVARILPWSELLIGILLLCGFFLRYTSLFATALLLLFFVLMLRSYGKGMGIDCGCFGFGEPLSVTTLLRDGALLACSFGLLAMSFLTRRM
jgi:putative oxidoreductase